MTVHYQNSKNEEIFISGMVHLQNIDDETWEALMDSEKILFLKTRRIEGIYHENTKTVNVTKERGGS